MAGFGLAMADLVDRGASRGQDAASRGQDAATPDTDTATPDTDTATPDAEATSGKDAATPGKAAATAPAEVTMRIRGLSSDGSGVGNSADGRVVFVPRTAPGDEVRVRITSGKPRWAKGQLRELLVPSPHRVPPACPYYEECGGCTLQHVAYAEQLHWKGDTVREALKRIAHVDIGLPEVVPSPKEHHYRSRLTFTLIRLPGGRVVAGFHRLGASNRIVDVDEGCILPEPAVASAWAGLRRA